MIGGLEQARLVGNCTGKAAFAVAEKLAFHQLGRYGAAVDRYKGLFGSGAERVNATGDQFLAAAGLAADIQRRLAAGEFADLVAQSLDWWRDAEDRVLCLGAGFGLRISQAQCRRDQLAQAGEIDRFGQEVKCAGLECADRRIQTAIGGDHRDRGAGKVLLDMAYDAQAIAVRQSHVRQAQIKVVRLQQVQGFAHGFRAAGLQRHAPEGQLQQFENVRLVVDDQHGGLHHGLLLDSCHLITGHHTSRFGCAKVMRMQQPWGCTRSHSSRAWLLSHSSREIYRPRPVPVASVV